MVKVLDTPQKMRAFSKRTRSTKTLAFVPTMGALHEGHLTLIRAAKAQADKVVVSIYVNPLQFDDKKDLKRYPRTLDNDLKLCKKTGAHAVFTPSDAMLYPQGFDTKVSAGALALRHEGKSRPGHFSGMLTVVLKLLNIVQPDVACFGEKDFQQLALIKRMALDFDLPLRISGVPIVRENDGLAMSSRNRLLSKKQREQALVLSKAIACVQERARAGESRTRSLLHSARKVLRGAQDFDIEYVQLVNTQTLVPLQRLADEGRLLIAGKMRGRKSVRLIDNGMISLGN